MLQLYKLGIQNDDEMTWLLGPWPMVAASFLWLLQTAAYAHRKDWGHATMTLGYTVATWGLIYTWFRP